MNNKMLISPAPHIKDSDSVPKIMYSVIASLIPAGIGAVYFFGVRTVWIMAAAILAAVFTECICQKAMKRPVTITDGSAILTGLLLAYNLPPEVPLWLPVIGSIVGILIGKQLFGGLGYNPMNPALIGRAFLMASWPIHMTIFSANSSPKLGTLSGIPLKLGTKTGIEGIDGITQATPLNIFQQARDLFYADHTNYPKVMDLLDKLYSPSADQFFGRIGGCIGETSVFLLLLGAVFLMYKRIIGWKIPFSYLATVALITWIFGGIPDPTTGKWLFQGNPLFHMMTGGLILGAFFMATDMVTSPVTFKGRLVFGIGCGILTSVIRLWGGYPEGVSYSILLMNLATPLIDKLTKPKKFGGN